MLDSNTIFELADKLGCTVLKDEPMKKHTTFRIGGNADFLITVPNKNAVSEILEFCKKNEIEPYIIGNGSNLLVSDKGIRGLCIKYSSQDMCLNPENSEIIECSSAVPLSNLCRFALDKSLSGLEFAWGIPGTLGGAIYMNAGAYGSEIKNVVAKTTHLDSNGKEGAFSHEELEFAYRKSVYTNSDYFILSASLKLKKGNKSEIKRLMDTNMKKRTDKQPLNYPSAGSVFKRPEGYFAGGLVEECGLKGVKIGGAMVSEKHAGFIVNVSDASCDDVIELIEKIKRTVYERKDVKLECEIKIL